MLDSCTVRCSRVREILGTFVFIFLFASGCAQQKYEFAPGIAPEGEATIQSDSGDDPVRLVSIDDFKAPQSQGYAQGLANGQGYIIHVTPGTHTLSFQCWFEPFALFMADCLPGQKGLHFLISSESTISFETAARHTYSLVGSQSGSRWKVSVEDRTAGNPTVTLPTFLEGDLHMIYVP